MYLPVRYVVRSISVRASTRRYHVDSAEAHRRAQNIAGGNEQGDNIGPVPTDIHNWGAFKPVAIAAHVDFEQDATFESFGRMCVFLQVAMSLAVGRLSLMPRTTVSRYHTELIQSQRASRST